MAAAMEPDEVDAGEMVVQIRPDARETQTDEREGCGGGFARRRCGRRVKALRNGASRGGGDVAQAWTEAALFEAQLLGGGAGPVQCKCKEDWPKKRKIGGNQEQIYELLGTFCQNTNARALRIGIDYEVVNAKKAVYAAVNKVEGLTLQQKLFVDDKLAKKIEDVHHMFSLRKLSKLNIYTHHGVAMYYLQGEPNWVGLAGIFDPLDGVADVIGPISDDDYLSNDEYESDDKEEFEPEYKKFLITGYWGWPD
ncbi:hypothetical protein BUALT_Bualt07G0043700 [Buddleja alternifolia]|uniref:Uncharacterized protein n=1 Tax=Buddleja alternifolia TaxID=168488 RepID=A0AAV6XFV0_9LAMI|nr:hypothetical protein BUALT_Bualt07G0043700 [Buddleja alternifolia]